MVDPMPLRLSRAMSIISRTRDPDAGDASAACGETSARIIMLEEALIALLTGGEGAVERAHRVLAIE